VKVKAPRNKTIELSPKEINSLARQSCKLLTKVSLDFMLNKIIHQDALNAIDCIPADSIDLMIVDPPYNLTKIFGSKTFKEMDMDEYKKWFDKWLKKTVRILKEGASIYICSDWKTSIVIPEIASKYFSLQNRITWEREKGRGSSNNWKNCIEDIWFLTKGKNHKFNLDAVKIQRPVIAPYRDEKGNPKDWEEKEGGKTRFTHPSNVWTDISIPFWSMPENTNHPTQKPEKLIAKLVLASSDEGDVVFDPFVGSGTTAVVAKKLGRNFIGIEREKEYVALSIRRLEMAEKDKSIQGFEDGIFKSRIGMS
jgi:site-specific DNA-methyltransferase (adenine-specific)